MGGEAAYATDPAPSDKVMPKTVRAAKEVEKSSVAAAVVAIHLGCDHRTR